MDARTRVLVVDDEPFVGQAARRVLERAHHVTLATSGEAALASVRAHDFDAVVCDLMMPGMDGRELHAHIAALRPGLDGRMIFVTGGVFEPDLERFLDAQRPWCLDKPWHPQALLEVVAARIADAGGPVSLAPGRRMV